MCLGMSAVESYKYDPLCRAVRRLSNSGILVFAADGNNGKDHDGNKIYGLIHSPGNEPSAITVGASNTFQTDERKDDGVATYSSRGPTRSYWTDESGVNHHDNLLKPDLVAPGIGGGVLRLLRRCCDSRQSPLFLLNLFRNHSSAFSFCSRTVPTVSGGAYSKMKCEGPETP
jgi:serine protease AprX